MHHSGPPRTLAATTRDAARLNWDRAEVLDDDQIDVGKRLAHCVELGWVGRAELEGRVRSDLDRSFAGDGDRVEPERLDRPLPVAGYDRHSVGHPQPEDETKAHTGMTTTMPDLEADPTVEQLTDAVGAVMRAAWVDLGYTAPNTDVYPWLWLWDSCFHVLIWAQLGEFGRACAELRPDTSRPRTTPVSFLTWATSSTRRCRSNCGADRARRRSPGRPCSATPSPNSSDAASRSNTTWSTELRPGSVSCSSNGRATPRVVW